MRLSLRQQRTWLAIFTDPLSSSLSWSDIETLFRALGAEVTEGNGSRVRVRLGPCRAIFHRPHPRKETDRGALRSVRDFLTDSSVQVEMQDGNDS